MREFEKYEGTIRKFTVRGQKQYVYFLKIGDIILGRTKLIIDYKNNEIKRFETSVLQRTKISKCHLQKTTYFEIIDFYEKDFYIQRRKIESL